MNKIYGRRVALVVAVVIVAQLGAFAQTPSQTNALTVRRIMAEPSLVGMRATGVRLAPDGKWCAFLWSARGSEPRDLYVVATTAGGAPRLLVRVVDAPQTARTDKGETRDEAGSDARKEERVMQRDAAQAKQSTTTQQTTIQQATTQQATTGQAAQRETSQMREASIGAPMWSPDNRRVLYTKRGDLYVVNIEGSDVPRRLTNTAATEAGARWLSNNRVLYQSSGNLFAFDIEQASLVQLTREGTGGAQAMQGVMGGANITGVEASDDGSRVAYITADTSKQRALVVPNYTGEFVIAPTFRRGWTEQKLFVVNADGTSERPTEIKLPAPESASYIRGVRWTADNTSLIVDRIDRDTKRRQLFFVLVSGMVNVVTSTTDLGEDDSFIIKDFIAVIDEETDDKWVASLSRIVERSPKGNAILFASERDGFNHLYVDDVLVKLNYSIALERLARKRAKGEQVPTLTAPPAPRQITRGNYEVSWATWMPDGERVIYSSTDGGTAERQLFILNTRTNEKSKLNTMKGMNTEAQLSKSGDVLAFEHSNLDAPGDVYAVNLSARDGAPRRLTETAPTAFKSLGLTKPQFFSFAAKDGKRVPARVYLPADFDKSKKYPAVVFVHGAGYLQNIINGWNNYYREAMFNTLLTQRGYVVLDIDFRGSAGYGRAWRTDVYDFLGGLDLQDHLDGIDYVVANYNVDKARVGMYGGSYGGFMAEMAAMRAPEYVRCAAALRPVADWKNYFASSPVYTTERLGYPDKNPEAYKRSSPITYADKLTRPLLILHGMVDDNVHAQDSMQLVERLIQLGKSEYFEAMFYPSENHAFTKPESWTDEYERILRFFELHLKK